MACMVSSATPTTINSEVPPTRLNVCTFVRYGDKYGIRAITARNIAPASVILDITRSRYSSVGLPGLIPGIKLPYFFRFSVTSGTLKVTAV